jgi:tetratricopeptide (TPR) repeat protein
LNGQIRRPPDWTSLVGPLAAACTGGDARAVATWRQRHAVLVGVWEELSRRDRRQGRAGPLAASVAPPGVTCTVPAGTAAFAGRGGQIGQITRAVAGPGGLIAIHAIGGMPGVGKTALAVHAGHLVAGRFPDRQLFVDLHGHTPGQLPADPADVLAALLAADGVDPRYLPAGLDGRAAMWRGRMAGKRVLLILDNAASSGQVTPLLPGTAGCLVLVTSRRFLGDLPGAVAQMPLDTLPSGDAAAMFASMAPRAAGEPEKVAGLARLCGGLPLAISLLAGLFTRHQSWTLDDLIGETRARLLTVSAESRTVAAAFELSYQSLDTGRQRFFRQLGLHPGADIDAYAAAALASLPPDQAAGHLDILHSDSLLAEPVPRRYRMHDLIRQYARGLADGDPAGEREQAIGRLLDYYQHAAHTASTRLALYPRPAAAAPAPPPAAMPGLAARDQALAWLTGERASLLACIDYAAARHQHARVTGLTAAIAPHLRSHGPWPQAIALHTAAVLAAQHLGDRPAEASALRELGGVRRLSGDYPGATKVLDQALDISRDLGDRPAEASALLDLGDVRRLTDDYPGATDALQHALDISRDLGDRPAEANALRDLGDVRRLTGDYPRATEVLDLALRIFRDLSNRLGAASVLGALGELRQATGDYLGATEALEQALDIFRSLGDRLGEASALGILGEVRRLTGDYPGATEVLDLALEISRAIGNRHGEAEVLNYAGTMHLARGDHGQARGHHQRALEVARDIGSRLEEARALEGLGKCARTTPSVDTPALREALEIYRRIGAADASRLGAEMADPQ